MTPHVCDAEGGALTTSRVLRLLLAFDADGDLESAGAVVGTEIGECWRCWFFVACGAVGAATSAIHSRAELTGEDPRPALDLHLSAALAQLHRDGG